MGGGWRPGRLLVSAHEGRAGTVMPGWVVRLIALLGAYLPATLARSCARVLGGAAYATFGSSAHRRAARIIELALGESPREARRISLQYFRRVCSFHCDYRDLITGDHARALELVESVDVRGMRFAHSYCGDRVDPTGSGPLVVATIHMGSYLRGLAKLVRISPPGRRIRVITLREWAPGEELGYRRLAPAGTDVQAIPFSDRPGVKAWLELRAGNTLLVMFDTPLEFGTRRSVVVPLFGRNARLPAGAALLALLAGAVILPAVSYADELGREVLHFERPLQARVLDGEDLALASERIMQQLAALAERWIRARPGEWLLWHRLPEFWSAAG